MKELDIDGIVTLPEELSQDEFFDKLIEFLESIGCTFGGKIVEVK